MEEIKITKLTGADIRRSGVQVRVAADINRQLMDLSEETGLTKTLITDLLLRKALKYVVVTEQEI